jgi:hypothetical protein
MPRLHAIQEYLKECPPAHVLISRVLHGFGVMRIKKPESKVASSLAASVFHELIARQAVYETAPLKE